MAGGQDEIFRILSKPLVPEAQLYPSTLLTKTRRVPHPRFVRVGLGVELVFDSSEEVLIEIEQSGV